MFYAHVHGWSCVAVLNKSFNKINFKPSVLSDFLCGIRNGIVYFQCIGSKVDNSALCHWCHVLQPVAVNQYICSDLSLCLLSFLNSQILIKHPPAERLSRTCFSLSLMLSWVWASSSMVLKLCSSCCGKIASSWASSAFSASFTAQILHSIIQEI